MSPTQKCCFQVINYNSASLVWRCDLLQQHQNDVWCPVRYCFCIWELTVAAQRHRRRKKKWGTCAIYQGASIYSTSKNAAAMCCLSKNVISDPDLWPFPGQNKREFTDECQDSIMLSSFFFFVVIMPQTDRVSRINKILSRHWGSRDRFPKISENNSLYNLSFCSTVASPIVKASPALTFAKSVFWYWRHVYQCVLSAWRILSRS